MLYVWTDDDKTKILLPIPVKFTYTYSDVDKASGRNDEAFMMRERIASKTKLTVKWSRPKDQKEFNRAIKLLKSLPPFFYLMYPDPDGSMEQIECYRNDISAELIHFDPNIWGNFSANFIER